MFFVDKRHLALQLCELYEVFTVFLSTIKARIVDANFCIGLCFPFTQVSWILSIFPLKGAQFLQTRINKLQKTDFFSTPLNPRYLPRLYALLPNNSRCAPR